MTRKDSLAYAQKRVLSALIKKAGFSITGKSGFLFFALAGRSGCPN
jgi:hypothetical protein